MKILKSLFTASLVSYMSFSYGYCDINKGVDGVFLKENGTILYYTDQIKARSAGNIKDPMGEHYLKLLLQALNNPRFGVQIRYTDSYKHCEGASTMDALKDTAKPLWIHLFIS